MRQSHPHGVDIPSRNFHRISMSLSQHRVNSTSTPKSETEIQQRRRESRPHVRGFKPVEPFTLPSQAQLPGKPASERAGLLTHVAPSRAKLLWRRRIQPSHSHVGAWSARVVRERGKQARTPLAAFFNDIPIGRIFIFHIVNILKAHQWASAQERPTPTSTTNGTDSLRAGRVAVSMTFFTTSVV